MTGTTSLRRQIAGFMLSGILASAVYSGTIVGLVEVAGVPVMAATAIGFAAGTLVAWFANSRLTFREPLHAATLARFTVVRLLALVLNLGIMRATLWLGFPYGVGIAATLVLLPPVNFLLHRLWTFRRKDERPNEKPWNDPEFF